MEKLIKSVSTGRYEVELLQVGDAYVVVSTTTLNEFPSYSESIKDFHTASFLFDLKLEELDGN